MKKLFLSLIFLFGCIAQETVPFEMWDEKIVDIPQKMVDDIPYLKSAAESAKESGKTAHFPDVSAIFVPEDAVDSEDYNLETHRRLVNSQFNSEVMEDMVKLFKIGNLLFWLDDSNSLSESEKERITTETKNFLNNLKTSDPRRFGHFIGILQFMTENQNNPLIQNVSAN